MDERSPLTVIIPAFNEGKNLPSFLPELVSYCKEKKWNIILVNDGSIDETRTILNQFKGEEILHVIHHKLNKGYGAAIKSGLEACHTEYAITIDADGQHSLNDIDKLYEMITAHDADMVVGSRKNSASVSFYRGLGKSIIRTLAKIMMSVPIYDLNSGMKIYRTKLAKKYIHLTPDTMAFSDIITLVFINNRHLVLEAPITVAKRKVGKSKIGIETAFHTIMEIINIIILFSPMKIFLPISILCFLTTLAWGIPLIIVHHVVSTGTLLGVISGLIFFLLGLIAEQLSLIRRINH